ncbi:MAG TPA: NADH-quinone oxidoreductase subunit N [Gemmataceae bacterium]|nr:NADH-quinone oxidoreductase subunit N [Gemmataceae bacterium]
MTLNISTQDLLAFLPELILCAAIVFLLVLRLFKYFNYVHLSWVALGLTVVAFLYALNQWTGNYLDPRSEYTPQPKSLEMFAGLLIYDNFTIFLRLFLLGFTALILLLALQTGIPDKEDSADFSVLLLGATLGMCIMASSNHLMMVFIGIEMASLPSYALAGFLKGRRQSSEAALKYVVYGGGAAGVMLYGISLIAGKFGTGYLPDVAKNIADGSLDYMILLGGLFLLIGIAFKLAAVPFHFWCPDVFEGASAEVAGFLSVASKGAALALLARFVLVLAGPQSDPHFIVVAKYLVPTLAFFAAMTATFGNLAAYAQTNLKRLLAYSTIAHAGYMMMGLCALTTAGAGAVLFYLVVYLFMNLGAFAIVAYLRNLTNSEDLKDFRGLVYRAPFLVLTLAVFLLSLLGIPPLAGFMAKFQIFSVIFESARDFGTQGESGLSQTMYALLVIGGLNTVISALYYIKVLKVMIIDKRLEEVEGRPVERLKVPFMVQGYAGILALVLIVLGIFWDGLSDAALTTGVNGFSAPVKSAQRSSP